MTQELYKPTREQVQQIQLQKVMRGGCIGGLPLGYVYTGKSKRFYINGRRLETGRDVIIDPIKAQAVKELFKIYIAGVRHDDLRRYLFDNYQIDYSQSNIYKILKNPFYIGKQVYKGIEYPHNYEKIIEKKDFELVQNLLKIGSSSKRKITTFQSPYSRLIKCYACNGHLCGEEKRKSPHLTYYYFSCSGHAKARHTRNNISMDKIAEFFRNLFKPIALRASQALSYIDADVEIYGALNFVIDVDKRGIEQFKDNNAPIKYMFKSLEYGPNIFKYELNEPFATLAKSYDEIKMLGALFKAWSIYSKNPYLQAIIHNYYTSTVNEQQSEVTTITDPILVFCISGKTLEDIIQHFQLPMQEIQQLLVDFELNGKIIEEHGIWKTL